MGLFEKMFNKGKKGGITGKEKESIHEPAPRPFPPKEGVPPAPFEPAGPDRMRSEKDIEGLLKVLEEHESPKVRMQAVEALDQIPWQPGDDREGAVYWAAVYLYARPVLSKKSWREAAERLTGMSWQPDGSEAGAVLMILKGQWAQCAGIGLPALKPLFLALQDEDKQVREEAARALVQIGEPAVDFLVSALKQYYKWCFDDASSVTLRIAAADVLGKLGSPKAIPVLIDLGGRVLTTSDHRKAAARALAAIGGPAFETLLGLLQKDGANLQQMAAWALGEMKDPRAVEALIPILSKQPFHYPHAREAARQALKSITGQDFGQDAEQWREWTKGVRP